MITVPFEESRNISAESEEIHDVIVVRGVAEAERMAELVKTSEIDDCIPK